MPLEIAMPSENTTNYLEKLCEKHAVDAIAQLKYEFVLKFVNASQRKHKTYSRFIWEELDSINGIYHGQDSSFEHNDSCKELFDWAKKMDKLVAAQDEVRRLQIELYGENYVD